MGLFEILSPATDDLCKVGDFSVTIYTEASFEGND